MDSQKRLELLCEISRAGDLQRMCDLACQLTGNPVFVSDMTHTILAYTQCVEISDATWKDIVVNAHLDRSTLRQDRQVSSVHTSSTEQNRPVLVQDDNVLVPRIIKTLVYDQRAVGVLVLSAYLREFQEGDMELVELIASFLVPLLMKEQYRISGDQRTAQNYLIKLLEGASYPRQQVTQHLEALGFPLHPYTYVLALCSDMRRSDLTGELEQMRLDVSTVLQCPTFLYNSMLICVYGTDHPISIWPDQVPGLLELLNRWGLIAGVSRGLSHISNLRNGYLQAQAVLEKGKMLERMVPCYTFDSFTCYWLFDMVPPMELDQYCHHRIKALWDYDQIHGTELCITLQVYLEQAKSLSKTAEILFIHRNTVRYRINRCIELLEDTLEDGNQIFSYIFSLRLLEYRTKIRRDGPALFTKMP